MREVTVNKNDAGQRLDKYMSKMFETMPHSMIYKYIRKKCIRVNGIHPKAEIILNEDDKLCFYISDEYFNKN